jgi:glycosyltransferase involved in cell wall biosynthesis
VVTGVLRPVVSGMSLLVLRSVQGCFNAIVPATPAVARSFRHRKTIVVRNYPRIEDLVNGKPSTPFERRPMTALYLGSITALRGVEQIVTAMADPEMLAEARLLLVGDFEDDALRERVAALPGWARVDAIGHLPRARIPAITGNVRMGLLLFQPAPNHTEAMPTKLFEYMATGLPTVVSSTLSTCRDVVEEHRCGLLVDPTNSHEIAAAMRWLFLHPQEASAMGERGRHAVRGRYEWESEARNLVGLYQELTA